MYFSFFRCFVFYFLFLCCSLRSFALFKLRIRINSHRKEKKNIRKLLYETTDCRFMWHLIVCSLNFTDFVVAILPYDLPCDRWYSPHFRAPVYGSAIFLYFFSCPLQYPGKLHNFIWEIDYRRPHSRSTLEFSSSH